MSISGLDSEEEREGGREGGESGRREREREGTEGRVNEDGERVRGEARVILYQIHHAEPLTGKRQRWMPDVQLHRHLFVACF